MTHLEYDSSTIAVADPYTDFDFSTNELINGSGRFNDKFGLNFVSL